MAAEKNTQVLVVDDEADFRKLMKFWLESKGYSVGVASGGQEAVKMAEENAPDIIFMDLRMPVMDGLEAIIKIREFNKTVPIIIISAYVNDQKAKLAMPYGISGIFNKSKDFKEGLTLLESALRTHKNLKEK